MGTIATWLMKRYFKKLLKKAKKAALDEEQVKALGKTLRRETENKLWEWAQDAAGTATEYDDAALLLAQSWYKSRYLCQKGEVYNAH